MTVETEGDKSEIVHPEVAIEARFEIARLVPEPKRPSLFAADCRDDRHRLHGREVIALNLAGSQRWIDGAPVLIDNSIVAVFPALVARTLLGMGLIFQIAVAIQITGFLRPFENSNRGVPVTSQELFVAAARVRVGQSKDEIERAGVVSEVAREGRLAKAIERTFARFLDDAARLLVMAGINLCSL